ncbi:MAG: hypothetical protein IPL61_26190 [Myxococcales bacterium]|nr:hypothetical protein [Myxococcales bacterium]
MLRGASLIGLLIGLVGVAACGPGSSAKPTGTPTDPVAVCERVADVCRLDGNRLGVCVHRPGSAGLACASQH